MPKFQEVRKTKSVSGAQRLQRLHWGLLAFFRVLEVLALGSMLSTVSTWFRDHIRSLRIFEWLPHMMQGSIRGC